MVSDIVENIDYATCFRRMLVDVQASGITVSIKTQAGMGYTGKVSRVGYDFIVMDASYYGTVAIMAAGIAEVNLTPEKIGNC